MTFSSPQILPHQQQYDLMAYQNALQCQQNFLFGI